jgi:hypothetical protein
VDALNNLQSEGTIIVIPATNEVLKRLDEEIYLCQPNRETAKSPATNPNCT